MNALNFRYGKFATEKPPPSTNFNDNRPTVRDGEYAFICQYKSMYDL